MAADKPVDKPKGRGWHGDSAGHARAARIRAEKQRAQREVDKRG